MKANFSTSLKATAEFSHMANDSILLRLFAQYDIRKDVLRHLGFSIDIGSLDL